MNNLLSTTDLEKLRSFIDKAENIVIFCHINPDGDAIGSCLGWAEYLRTIGKSPSIIVPDQFPDFLMWMPNTEKIIRFDKHRETAENIMTKADLMFCLDLNDVSRTDGLGNLIQESKAKKVMFDHHLNPQLKCDIMISEPEISSTCEIVFRVVNELGDFDKMGSHFAAPIYCGMMTDTGTFTYNSTRPEIFFIISRLLTKNIDKDKIYRNVYNNYSEQRIRLIGYVLHEKLVVDARHHATFFTLTRDDLRKFNYIKGDAEGLVNMPLQIKGTKLSISLREDTEKDNIVWVSLRSVDDFPCNLVAKEFFNGGGHLNASGGRLNCSIDEAVRITKKAIEKFCS
ncbi:bifunctional oligoribonuclease/PAP phosphatase NrnA [Prevotella sp. PMUR]|uniref:Bifunctional oligoribonuclease/PAP phosphatase NrnA n=2 Tax=Xylanibacter muris TaxID=2736290 RepID=A0ABX2AN31_9BACT|nr:DHH family phosphoesterase [Xylanibacter muris]NPD92641.1 bifunctional oligoribonuclease/PAP phosphatase NrnA [Xylanibacter muris]